jgi:hypothetical protein
MLMRAGSSEQQQVGLLPWMIVLQVVALLLTRSQPAEAATWVHLGCYYESQSFSNRVFPYDAGMDHRGTITAVGCMHVATMLNISTLAYRLPGDCRMCSFGEDKPCENTKHGPADCDGDAVSGMTPMHILKFDHNQLEDLCDETYPYDCDLISGRVSVRTVLKAAVDRVQEDAPRMWPQKNYNSNCPALFREVLTDHREWLDSPNKTTPKKIPDPLMPDFTLNFTVLVSPWVDEDDVKEVYNISDVAVWNNQSLLDAYEDNYCFYHNPGPCETLFKEREDIIGPHIRNKTGIIFGTQKPWLEASLLFDAKAAHITTIEYFPIVPKHIPAWTPLQPTQVASQYLADNFHPADFAFSLSSFEHNGLGRYGDKLDPDGDFKSMAMARCLLNDGGILFLSVPVGLDVVYFNVHRVYGRRRLPLLLVGWELVDVIGTLSLDFPMKIPRETSVLVLRKV